MSDLKLDMKIAQALLSTAGKFKPKGVTRAVQVLKAFELSSESDSGLPLVGNAGDYLILTPDGRITIGTNEFVNDYFEPVAKRTRTVKS